MTDTRFVYGEAVPLALVLRLEDEWGRCEAAGHVVVALQWNPADIDHTLLIGHFPGHPLDPVAQASLTRLWLPAYWSFEPEPVLSLCDWIAMAHTSHTAPDVPPVA